MHINHMTHPNAFSRHEDDDDNDAPTGYCESCHEWSWYVNDGESRCCGVPIHSCQPCFELLKVVRDGAGNLSTVPHRTYATRCAAAEAGDLLVLLYPWVASTRVRVRWADDDIPDCADDGDGELPGLREAADAVDAAMVEECFLRR